MSGWSIKVGLIESSIYVSSQFLAFNLMFTAIFPFFFTLNHSFCVPVFDQNSFGIEPNWNHIDIVIVILNTFSSKTSLR